jgi:hypothetical protein
MEIPIGITKTGGKSTKTDTTRHSMGEYNHGWFASPVMIRGPVPGRKTLQIIERRIEVHGGKTISV